MPSKVISSAYNCRIAYNWLRNFWFYGQLRADGASDQTRVFLMPEYVSLTAIISFLFKGRPLMQIHNLMSGRLLSCSWSRITVDRDYCVMTSLGKLDTKQLFFYDSRSNWSLTSSLRFDAGTSCGGKSTHFNVHDNWEKNLPLSCRNSSAWRIKIEALRLNGLAKWSARQQCECVRMMSECVMEIMLFYVHAQHFADRDDTYP